MNEIKTVRNLDMVAAEIRALTCSMLSNIIEIGRRMVEAKGMLPYGEFGDWIKNNTGYSSSTANNFMRLYQEYGSEQGNLFGAEVKDFQTFGNLTYSKALALLALPSGEREEFVEQHDVEDMSVRELKQEIEARKQAEDKLKEISAELDQEKEKSRAYESTIEELDKQIEDLERRPVDVAVQEPDPAEIERRAAELAKEAAAEQERKIKELEEKAKAERDKLKEKLKAAEDKLDAAGAEDRAEAELLRAQVDAMRKELAMSGGEMVTFRLRFEAWQTAYTQLQAAMSQLPAEQQEKCAAAVKAQIEGWSAC